jgi:peptidoglycan hydrolase CwlO-like protein
MPSSLQELLDRRDALDKKLTRLKNLQQLMQTPNKSLDGEIHMTQLRLDEVRKDIDAYNKR